MGSFSMFKKAISIILALVLVLGIFTVSGVTATAAEKVQLDHIATIDDNLGRKQSDKHTGLSIENASSGGVRYEIHRLSASFPFVYSRSMGEFPGNGFMLEFTNFANESNHAYYGTNTILITLSKSPANTSIKKGMAAILLNASTGEVSLVETLVDIKGVQDKEEKADPLFEDYLKIKQKLFQNEKIKTGNMMNKTVRVTFLPCGKDIKLVTEIGNDVFSGIIKRDIFDSIENHPISDTYVMFSSIDHHYYEWNEWYITFRGHKLLSGDAVKNSDGSVSYENGFVPVNDKNIRWLGKWENNGSYSKGYFQSGFELNFAGTSAAIETDAAIIASIDGGKWEKFEKGTAVIASDLKNGNHSLKVMIPYENVNSRIGGIYISQNGKTLPPDTNKTIIFIGDSATAGYYGGDKKYENTVLNNYALQVANKMDYAISISAYSKATILDGEGTDKLGMPKRYFKLGELNSDAQNKDFEPETEPDCIVISLGAYGTNGGEKVGTAYEAFLDELRYNYPDSAIVCMTPFTDRNVDEIKKSVGNLQKAGDKNIYFLNASSWDVELCSDGICPTEDGHKTIASKLSSALKSIMSGKATISVTSKKPASSKPSDKSDKEENNVNINIENNVQNNIENNIEIQNNKDDDKKDEQITDIEDEEIIEEVIEEVVEEEQENILQKYLWLLILVAAVVVLGLLAVIFYPNIKKLISKK